MNFTDSMNLKYPATEYKEDKWYAETKGEAGSYKVGMYKEVSDKFDAVKAVKKSKFKEVSWDWFTKQYPDGELSSLGVSDSESHSWAINVTNPSWRFTFFHEMGHMTLRHSIIDRLMKPSAVIELEADLFAVFCMEELGLPMGVRAAEVSDGLILAKKNDWEFTDETVNPIKEKAKKFISLGAK